MTVRHLCLASALAGLVTLIGLLVGLADPAYYDPTSALDFIAAALNTLGFLTAAAALAVWWRVTPGRRGVLLLPLAATGFAVAGIGNLLEDVMGVGYGGDLFFFGGLAGFAMTALAGVVTVLFDRRWRWSGLVLLAIAGGFGMDGVGPPVLGPVVWAATWIGWAAILWRVSTCAEHQTVRST